MSPAPQPPDDTASISSAGQESPSEYSVEEVKKEFPLEKVYLGGKNELIDGLRSFANKFFFTIATRGRGEVRCVQASNTWSKKLESGECELSKARSSQTSNCKYCNKFSTGKITKINRVFDLHNHPYDNATAVAVTKKSSIYFLYLHQIKQHHYEHMLLLRNQGTIPPKLDR